MNADSLQYLAEHTDITFLSEGSIARGLVESANLEINRVQDYIFANHSNVFLNSASGAYLDLIGDMLGIRRLDSGAASTSASDMNVQFSVSSGNLVNYFKDSGNINQGKISAGISIFTADRAIEYNVSEDTFFPATAKSVFVSVLANRVGSNYSVGKNRLTVHSGPSGVSVTNLKPIQNGSGVESDNQFRFRLTNSLVSGATSNKTAIKIAAIGSPDISNVILKEYSRGAGTFDAVLVPVGNSVSFQTSELVRRSIESVSAFGVSPRVKQPDYVRFKISFQLVPETGTRIGELDANKIRAKNATLQHFESVRLGGELIINRLRSDIISSVNSSIKDIRIIELCFNGKPHTIRNYKLKALELFTPQNDLDYEAIEVI